MLANKFCSGFHTISRITDLLGYPPKELWAILSLVKEPPAGHHSLGLNSSLCTCQGLPFSSVAIKVYDLYANVFNGQCEVRFASRKVVQANKAAKFPYFILLQEKTDILRESGVALISGAHASLISWSCWVSCRFIKLWHDDGYSGCAKCLWVIWKLFVKE